MQNSVIDRIDHMEWLDILDHLQSHHLPIPDVDSFLNYVSKWPLFVHLASAAICLGFSALFHLFFVYSPEACDVLCKLDYTGITILIFGSTVPSISYMFACNEVACKMLKLITNQIDLRYGFLIMVGTTCSLVFIVSMMPTFSKPEYKWVRGSLFALLGAAVAMPMIYLRSNL